MRDGMRGFASLRTRPCRPIDQTLLRPIRRCARCGAVLRRSNPGPTCATQECSGLCVGDLTEPELALIESKDPERGVLAVARLRGYDIPEDAHNRKVARNEELIARVRDEGLTQAAAAAIYGISQNRVCEILRGK